MKKSILILLVLVSSCCYSQISDTIKTVYKDSLEVLYQKYSDIQTKINLHIDNSNAAGLHLQKAAWNNYAALGLIVVGIGFAILGSYAYNGAFEQPNNIANNAHDDGIVLWSVGGVFTAGSLACMISIPIHLEKAGKFLQKK